MGTARRRVPFLRRGAMWSSSALPIRSSSLVVQLGSVIAFGPRSGGLAAVDDHRMTDRERGFLRAQPQHGGGDLLGAAHAADRLLGNDGGAAFIAVAGEAAHHLGVDD